MPQPEPPLQVPAPASSGGVVPLTLKGLIAFLLLVLYSGLITAYVLAERQLLLGRLSAMDELHMVEEVFSRSGLAISNASLALRQIPLGADAVQVARENVPYAMEVVEQSFRELRTKYPAVPPLQAAVQSRAAAYVAQPAPASLIELRQALSALAREVDGEGRRAREQRRAMGRDYRDRYDRITVTALALGVAGLVVFGGISTLFFSRLAADLGLLERRAREIVSGSREQPLAVTRRDEVGALTHAVNRMAADLVGREREIAVARERRAHHEKMVALGAMASNLAHEIGNPLATISAVAESIDDSQAPGDGVAGKPGLILEQTRRIAAVTRRIADFAAQHRGNPEPVDLAGMLRAVADFLQFDPRFMSTRIDLQLPPDLPVLIVAPDQLSEVLMNLLLFSVDEDTVLKPGRVLVEAAVQGDAVVLRVSGAQAPRDGARLENTRRLVEGMGGKFSGAASAAAGCEVSLPACRAAGGG